MPDLRAVDSATDPTVAPRPIPRGRDAVVAAILDAATALFAERGPAAVSLRDIAARAQVNHGLIHRHFGSKQALLRAVLDRLVADLFAAAGSGAMDTAGLRALFAATAAHETYCRALARAVLDGEVPREFQSNFPAIRHLVEGFHQLQRRGALAPAFDPRVVAAGVAALVLGWLVFEPFLATAAGLDHRTREDNRGALLEAMLTALARMGGAEPRERADDDR